MSETPKKSGKEKHDFVLWSVRLTIDETNELLELGKVLYAYKKIPKCNKYNITKYALELLKQKLLEKVQKPNS